MSEIERKFDNFDIFRSILSHSPTEVCKYSIESLLDFEIRLCWTFANIPTTKPFKNYKSCTKTMILKIFNSFVVISKCFWSKTLQRSLQKCNAKLVLSLLSCLCWNLGHNLAEKVQKLHQKRQNLQLLWQFRDNLRHFFFTTWTSLVMKAHRYIKFAHALDVLTF